MLILICICSVLFNYSFAQNHAMHSMDADQKTSEQSVSKLEKHAMHETSSTPQEDRSSKTGKCPRVDQAVQKKGKDHSMEMNHEAMQQGAMKMKMKDLPPYKTMHDPAYAWADPKIKLSPPSKLMGKQMGVVNTIGIPPMGYEMDGNIKVFRLIAQPIEQYITDGKEPDYEKYVEEKNRLPEGLVHHSNLVQKIRAWGFNGSTPGPTIEANEGDTVRIIVSNELPEPLTVHWHGIELPNAQDGAGGFTQPVIMPGKCMTYEFTLYQSGTCFYHGEFNLTKASLFGLAGAFIIHPKEYEYKIDKEFVITLQEWRILPGNIYPDIMSMDFNWFTFNGHSAPTIPAMVVNQGERVRFRIINMSMDDHPIHWHGYTGWIVGTEGGPMPKSAQWPVNSVDVPPGASRDVEFVAWNPGIWLFHCHKLHHVLNGHANVPMGIMPHGGMFTIFYVNPKDPQAPWHHPHQDGHYKDEHYQPKHEHKMNEDVGEMKQDRIKKKPTKTEKKSKHIHYESKNDETKDKPKHEHIEDKKIDKKPKHNEHEKTETRCDHKKKWVYINKQWIEQNIVCCTQAKQQSELEKLSGGEEQTQSTSAPQGEKHAH